MKGPPAAAWCRGQHSTITAAANGPKHQELRAKRAQRDAEEGLAWETCSTAAAGRTLAPCPLVDKVVTSVQNQGGAREALGRAVQRDN